MLQNLTNFFSLITGRQIKQIPANDDLVALGTKDHRFTGGYRPTAITVEDLAAAIGGGVTLTVSGNNGPSTLIGDVLNIPTYTLTGLGGQPLATNLTSVAGLAFSSTSFVKMTASGTFGLDTNIYQGALTVTNTGTSGAATLIGNTLNIPNYATSGLPSWVETNGIDFTVWNNGKGNIFTNTSYGDQALKSNTTAGLNTAIGYQALAATTTGGTNVAVGAYALNSSTSGYVNVAIGPNALKSLTIANSNIGIGSGALEYNTTASGNIGIGYQALWINTTGTVNVAIGSVALFTNTTGTGNIAIGNQALRRNTTAGFNIAIGNSPLENNTIGAQNTAIGALALFSNTTGSDNTAIGRDALFSNTTANGNIAIGNSALTANTTGGGNTAVGVSTSSGNFSGSVILGNGATATANNQFVVGSSGTNAGTIATETITANRTWLVRINGANYKIPLLLIP